MVKWYIFGESIRKIKINEKIDETNIYNGFSSNIFFFYFRKNFFRLKKKDKGMNREGNRYKLQ